MDKGNWIVENVKDWVDPIFVPQCFPSQLKTCELLGQDGELLLAIYIVKNARVLQPWKSIAVTNSN